MPDRLAEIRGRLDRATPGPWTHDTSKWDEEDHTSPDLVCAPPTYDNVARCYPRDLTNARPGQDHSNAAFIARCPEDVAWLLEQVTAARETADLLAQTVELLIDHPDQVSAAKDFLVMYRHVRLDWNPVGSTT